MVASTALRHRSVVTAIALALLGALVVPGTAEAQTPPDPTETNWFTGPGAILAGYATPVVVATQGSTGRYSNYDTTGHNVWSVDEHPDGGPLFSSATIGLFEDTPVNGVEDLEPGVYEFYCTPHSQTMRGQLVVLPVEGGDGGGLPDPGDLPGLDDLPELPPDDPADPPPPGEPSVGSWPMFGRDLANSRATDDGPDAADLLTYQADWSYTDGGFPGTPVVIDDRLFMGSDDGRVVALDTVTGAPAWEADLNGEGENATITATVAYHDGVVYVPVSGRAGGAYIPYVAALDATDGELLWRTFVDDEQPLGDLYGSPVVWETTVENAEGEEEPFVALYIGTSSWDSGTSGASELHLGTVVALDLLNDGELLWRTYMVEGGPQTKDDVPVSEDTGKPYDGAAVWSTPTVDTETGEVFVGTGNGYESTHSLVASIAKLDGFTGDLLDHYQATETDAWQIGSPNRGVDADFGASPQLVEGPGGERWVGAGQKNNHLVEDLTGSNAANTMVGLARYHMVDRDTMEEVWVTPVGPGYWWGGITGATAYDGERIYGSTVWGQLFALDAHTGLPVWMTSAGDAAVHMAHTQVANGIVYSTDGKGFVSAWDADLGIPLWTRPMISFPDSVGPAASGVAIVGDTIYASMGFSLTPGSINAFRAQ